MARLKPTMHHEIPMESRVSVDPVYTGKAAIGTVVGIGMLGIIFSYIVLLDEPYTVEGDTMKAILVSGPQLKVL